MKFATWNEMLRADPGLVLATTTQERIADWPLFLLEPCSGIPLCLDWNWSYLQTCSTSALADITHRQYGYEEQAFTPILTYRKPNTRTIYSVRNLTALLLPITFREYVDRVFDKLTFARWREIQNILVSDTDPDNHVTWQYVCDKREELYNKGLPD